MVIKAFSVRDALTDKLARVLSEQHPQDNPCTAGTVRAVFNSDKDGAFLGLVTEKKITQYPQRIFADLVTYPLPTPLSEHTPLETLESLLDEETNAVAIIDANGDLIGAVTHTSLLATLLALHQSTQQKLLDDQAQLTQWSKRLDQLNKASRTLLEQLADTHDIQILTQRGIEVLVALIKTRFGAVGLLEDDGRWGSFVHTGENIEQFENIETLPEGKGLLGVIVEDNGILNIPDIAADSRAAGFPSKHPLMTSLLATPISNQGKILGRVYLCDKVDGKPFTTDDEQMIKTFSNTFALVLLQAKSKSQLIKTQQKTNVLLGENRRLTQRLLANQEQINRYVARELHDEMGQYCTAIQANIQTIIEINKGSDHRIYERCVSTLSMCDHVHETMQSILLRLRPALLDEMGLEYALEESVSSWSNVHSPIDCQLNMMGQLDNLNEPLNIGIFRIIQECLTNIARHAEATSVIIQLQKHIVGNDIPDNKSTLLQKNHIILMVKDNGKGFSDIPHSKGLGLTGIRERVFGLGGDISIDNKPHKGVCIIIRLPINYIPSNEGTVFSEIK